ncbi:MAG: hypothetical protein ACRD82_11580, partial [Blastocatellia bacterium]
MIQIELLRQVMNEISAEKGEFALFGLFLREESMDKWDLVVSAPWLQEDKLKSLREVVKKMSSIIGEKELLKLSRIVTLNQDDPNLIAILKAVKVEGGVAEMRDTNLFGLVIKQAY